MAARVDAEHVSHLCPGHRAAAGKAGGAVLEQLIPVVVFDLLRSRG
ncbi:MAG: hypothetical protein M3548_23895 [Actinomycetota bacterium]|nr:hypothetical protein [Actinomycetota bacterium]